MCPLTINPHFVFENLKIDAKVFLIISLYKSHNAYFFHSSEKKK